MRRTTGRNLFIFGTGKCGCPNHVNELAPKLSAIKMGPTQLNVSQEIFYVLEIYVSVRNVVLTEAHISNPNDLKFSLWYL
jgi:hypothetical protein